MLKFEQFIDPCLYGYVLRDVLLPSAHATTNVLAEDIDLQLKHERTIGRFNEVRVEYMATDRWGDEHDLLVLCPRMFGESLMKRRTT